MSTSRPPVGYDQYGLPIAPKPPRPEAKRGASFLMIGGVAHVAASFLPWFRGAGFSANGFDTFPTQSSGPLEAPGRIWFVLGIIFFGIGLVTYLFGRIFALAVIATVLAVLDAVFGWPLAYNAATNMAKITFGGIGGPTSGVYVGIVSVLITLAGAIQILSRRRQ